MSTSFFRRGAVWTTALGCALGLSSCTRQPPPQTVDGVTYGTTTLPFRGRWWHYYERGVSWSLGGFLDEAEQDLRASLRLRKTDARRARTYGFRFVQCFAHRELAAVLIEKGELDEAETLLKTSMGQEPSAKAAALLERLASLRAGQEQVEAVGLTILALADDPAQPTVIPHAEGGPAPVEPADAASAIPELALMVEDIPVTEVSVPALALQSATVQVDEVELMPTEVEQTDKPQAFRMSGSLDALEGVALFAIAADDSRRVITIEADGSFEAAVEAGETLVFANVSEPERSQSILAPGVVAAAPSLTLDGPTDGAVVTSERLYFRYRAASQNRLATLVATDQNGRELAALALSGVATGGIFTVPVDGTVSGLVFRLSDADGATVEEDRAITVRPAPAQLRSLRAATLLIPLQHPEDGRGLAPTDDPLFSGAVVDDGRFRVVDQGADALLQQELALVEAGYVDRVTAARAGQRLQARYVVTGTIRRGRGDLECYLRLVHVESGAVVATADAYLQGDAAADEARFFELLAGRLSQVFPVIGGALVADGEGLFIRSEQAGLRPGMRFHAVQREPDVVDPASGKVLLPGRVRVLGTYAATERGGLTPITLDDDQRVDDGAVLVSE